ncbi:hypothetical protein ACH414_10940 [Streptomyces sp. NPDC020422]|uniref:hypothetical protein n=1 Tax=Streptomyces sp. NPDC020422 TaxID=3365074 RepID=UPI0037ADDEAE
MRHLPTPVRWAATAFAVAACAGLSGCMSVSDDGAKPAPSSSAGKRGEAAGSAEDGGLSGGHGGGGFDRTARSGPDADGSGKESPVPSGSATAPAKSAGGVGAGGAGGAGGASKPTQPPGGTGGPAASTGGDSGAPGGETTPPVDPPQPTPTQDPTTPPPEPTAEPTVSETPSTTPGADTHMGAMRAAEGPGGPTEPEASPQARPM